MYYWKQGSLVKRFTRGLVHAEGEGGGQGDKGDKGGETKWYSDLPEDMQAWDEVKNAKSAEDYHKYVGNMRSHLGQSIRIPGSEAGKEDWESFNKKLAEKVPTLMPKPNLEDADSMKALYGSLGRPESVEGYKAPELEGMNKDATEAFKTIALDIGINQAQYAKVVEAFTALNVQANADQMAAHETSHAELKKEWGADYNNRMSIAANIAKLTDAPEGLQQIFADGKADPESYKWMYNLAQKFKGGGENLLKDLNDQKVGTSPEEAAIKIAEIRGNKEHAYFDKTNPGHEMAKKLMKELYEAKLAG